MAYYWGITATKRTLKHNMPHIKENAVLLNKCQLPIDGWYQLGWNPSKNFEASRLGKPITGQICFLSKQDQ